MSFKHTAIGVFRCDSCRAKEIGYLGEVPDGWVEYVKGTDPLFPERAWVQHDCPRCSAKKSIDTLHTTDVH